MIESAKNYIRNSGVPEEMERTHWKDARWETTKIKTSGKTEVEVIPKREGETKSWKIVEEHRINKPS
jgi:hypothetical protein